MDETPTPVGVLINNTDTMKHLTVLNAKKYIKENYGQAKHNVSNLVKASKLAAKEYGEKPIDIFLLLIENKEIVGSYTVDGNKVVGCYTHSYGFHTAYGRELIENTQSYYFQLEKGLSKEDILILN